MICRQLQPVVKDGAWFRLMFGPCEGSYVPEGEAQTVPGGPGVSFSVTRLVCNRCGHVSELRDFGCLDNVKATKATHLYKDKPVRLPKSKFKKIRVVWPCLGSPGGIRAEEIQEPTKLAPLKVREVLASGAIFAAILHK